MSLGRLSSSIRVKPESVLPARRYFPLKIQHHTGMVHLELGEYPPLPGMVP